MNALDVIDGRAEWSVDVDDSSEWVRDLPEGSVHEIITSPPYYGLRDYAWVGGDPRCAHGVTNEHQKQGATSLRKGRSNAGAQRNESFVPDCVMCSKCGAHRVAGQIGLEETPEEYVERLVRLFRRARRALHPTGSLWLNLGDSYVTNPSNGRSEGGGLGGGVPHRSGIDRSGCGLPAKNLIGIPWRVAFALQADGWYLRQWCPWVKRNPMPESADDRPGTACETIFLFTKESDYFFDMEAVRRPSTQPDRVRNDRIGGNKINATKHSDGSQYEGGEERNFRSADLWFESVGMLIHDGILLGFDAPLKGYKGAHFATFPERLIRPMILAGTSAKGVCPRCSAPWLRIVEKERVATRPGRDTKVTGDGLIDGNRDPERHVTITKTLGWEPSCRCGTEPVPAVVMDPFTGSGTTGAVVRSHGRRFIGCDLNSDYAAMARKRIGNSDPGLF